MTVGSGAAVEVTRIVAIRHGETDWNAQKRLQGQLDIGLNALGREQARRLAAALAGEEFAAVYASDLERARRTAEAFALPAGLPVKTDRGLRERGFGIFEGYTYSEIEARWPEDTTRWRRREPEFAPAGGETLEGFQARCVATAARLAAAHAGESIALVAHGGVLDALYRAATHVGLGAPRSWELGNASINRLLHNGEGFVLVGWDDRRHLED
jgi:2,3-bisphosphoglycerate-dependent phosphoglycerate mutase